jgi:DNA-binding CsgD family transcriptional regulator
MENCLLVKALKKYDLPDLFEGPQFGVGQAHCEELQNKALNLLERLFNAKSCMIFFANECGNRVETGRYISRNVNKKYIAKYIDYYWKLDPIQNLQPVHAVFPIDRFCPFTIPNAGRYYREFLKPQSIEYLMGIPLKSGHRVIGGVGVHRSKDAGNFSSQEIHLAERVSLFLSETFAKEKILHALINSIAETLPYKGIIVLDDSLAPVYMNEFAESLLYDLSMGKTGVKISASGLPEEIYSNCENLRNRCSSGEDPQALQTKDMVIKGKNQEAVFHIHALHTGEASWRFFICLCQNEPDGHLYDYLKGFGISRRESEIACLVCKGFNNKEIAARLYLAEITVEKHIQSIFNKLGVTNRTMLAHRVFHIMHPLDHLL